MSNIKTLKPFLPGHDPRRNIKGRISKPVSETGIFKRLLLEHMQKKVIVGGEERRIMDIIVERIVNDAAKGKASAIKLILDRTEGKSPTQKALFAKMDGEERGVGGYEIPEEDMARLRKIFGDT